jgi:heme-degrading monooxygenase HmoA
LTFGQEKYVVTGGSAMVICLFGVRYKTKHDVTKEKNIDALLLPELRIIPGFVSLHVYSADDGEVLGVVRFDTKDALEAWRDNVTHRGVWKYASDFYRHFWIQNSETYREYGWSAELGRTREDLRARFANDAANLAGRVQ